MSSKSKPAEVTSARIRLDATLQHLVDKKDDELDADDTDVSSTLLQTDSFSKPSPSPKKSTSKTNRKRKRRSDSTDDETADGKQTVVMKLFERSVDLAQFPEDTPLYPVCRAWLHNRPQDKTLGTLIERQASPKIDEEVSSSQMTGDMPNVYEMPPPIKSEDGCLYDLRVPEPVAQPPGKLDIYADPQTIPEPEQLLLDHLARWKETRNRWREASAMNEMQYASSINLLKEMFENNMDPV
ncbi:protein lin-37 homolog [Plakobranchus ocellatus]|uniref:Protein lin-37 homolog n=1 Tax=Plakobranchus ocellatus TaxID=259542 RepID=A0AAV4ADL5_9GAST|nr:protein lin-37 homolog [Plakobranchus ocellatus]